MNLLQLGGSAQDVILQTRPKSINLGFSTNAVQNDQSIVGISHRVELRNEAVTNPSALRFPIQILPCILHHPPFEFEVLLSGF